jgi:hypothetical protein
MNLPKALNRINKGYLEELGKEITDGELCIVDGHIDGELAIYRPPVEIQDIREDLFRYGPLSKNNIGYYIRENYGTQSGLWGHFSEALNMLKLNDGKYNLKTTQANALASAGSSYENAFHLLLKDESGLKPALGFLSRRMLTLAGIKDIGEKELKKLVDFLFEDYMTGIHTKESERIGADADSIFFPHPEQNLEDLDDY